MIVNWKSIRDESPITTQLIEKHTGFKYSVPYGTLINDVTGDHITYAQLEGFFDDHGWFLTLIPLNFPSWNGIISDTVGKIIFNNVDQFKDVSSRNHAKSLIAGIAIKYFEATVSDIMKLPEGCLKLTAKDVESHAKDKPLETILLSDLTIDARGLVEHSSSAVLEIDGRLLVIKNTQENPYVGLILNA